MTPSPHPGVGDQLGTLEAGRLADVIAVPSDPSGDVAAVEKVVYRNDGKR